MKKEQTQVPGDEQNVYKKRSQLMGICRRFAKSRTAMVGLVMLIILVTLAVAAPLFIDYKGEVIKQNIRQRLQGPSFEHPFGTDQYGRDVWTRILYGGRVSLTVAVCATLIAAVCGTLIGCVSGYFGGAADLIIGRLMDIFMAFPMLLSSLIIGIVLGASLPTMFFSIGIPCIPMF